MSNFSLLNYYVAALIVYNILYYVLSKTDNQNKDNKFHFIQLNKINLWSILFSAMVLFEPLRRISKKTC